MSAIAALSYIVVSVGVANMVNDDSVAVIVDDDAVVILI